MSRTLYPKISPTHTQLLEVGNQHSLYVEQTGNPEGTPVIYIHGGPGAGSSENYRRYFDPERYHIILFDQRGCGRSMPSPSIEANTLWDLVADLERIREALNVSKWLVTGGSWGTTVALAYGIKYPNQCLGFILRGVFLGEQQELDWLYQSSGAARFFPEYYREFTEMLSLDSRSELLEGYHQLIHSENEIAATAAAKAWFLWELRLSSIEHHHVDKRQIQDSHQALCMAKLSTHYFVNNCFMSPSYLLANVDQISHLPAIVLHGRYDMVCQLDSAYKLVSSWRNSSLQILPCAGHSGFETQTIDAFCKAADTMASFFDESTPE
ncbi:prolyl aminopeptidase [Thalassotalea euphylliae]|uniref:prolyl aminopeptidase n=1 Tax=Thalassotalea euphylliae TaxID=1655234 RepID=UPI00363D17DE